MSMF
jgi:hypothetical protein